MAVSRETDEERNSEAQEHLSGAQIGRASCRERV